MKKTIFSLATLAMIAASCSDNTDINSPIDPNAKEMISFSLSDGASSTRAGFTGSTNIAMRMQSDEKGTSNVLYTRTVATADADATQSEVSFSNVTFQDAYKRYWDDAFGRKGLISVYAVAVPNGSSTLKNNEKTLEELLAKGDESNTWGTTATNTIAWKVEQTAQTKDATLSTPASTIDKEDLVYANNIQADATLGKDGIYRWNYSEGKHLPVATGENGKHKNGRMLFYQQAMTDDNAATTASTSDPGHFDKGHLKFNHALSRMTIIIENGEGAGTFDFATGTNIKLLGMNVSGKLDIKTGNWSDKATGDITKIAKTANGTKPAEGTYVAQMLPDYTFGKASNTNVLEFTIDNNTYYITQKMLFEALTYDKDGDGVYDAADGDGQLVDKKGADGITMEQGKNYVFKIKVNKKQIENITATLAKWVDVTAADESINNAHVKFTLGTYTGDNCTEFQFYRLKQDLGSINTTNSYTADAYRGNYKADGAAKIESMPDPNGSKYQATGWFFDDNRTAYHFRTLNPLAADEGGSSTDDKSENIANTSDPANSYFTMKAEDSKTKDYHWGAPLETGKNLAYSPTEGYKANLHKGITSTESDLKITEFHMMSNLNIVLKTSTGSDKVDLSNATITLTKLSKQATVDMGVGHITPNVTSVADNTQLLKAPASTDYWTTANTQTKPFTCSVIPQALVRNAGSDDDDYVGITITTSDHNQYYVVKRLSEIYATTVTDQRDQTQYDDSKTEAENEAAKIKRWFPGHNYTYTFTITKNGIDNITATVAKWVDVTAGNKDLNLES